MEAKKNWLVRIYNNRNKIVDKWIVENRTENEAQKETESEVGKASTLLEEGLDWTMSPVKSKKIKEAVEILKSDPTKMVARLLLSKQKIKKVI